VHRSGDIRGEFAEQLAMIYEQVGLPRMAGRILGWLLVCEPAHPTLDELARAVHGSKASMSTMSRLLEQMGIAQRHRRPGEKRDRIGIRPDVWSELSRREAALARSIRELCDRTIEALPDRGDAKQRLWGYRAQYAFLEQELPRIFERFRESNPLAAAGPPPPAAKAGKRR
jgi:DNA-binding transcriptional regulator GbsR (MarR family)